MRSPGGEAGGGRSESGSIRILLTLLGLVFAFGAGFWAGRSTSPRDDAPLSFGGATDDRRVSCDDADGRADRLPGVTPSPPSESIVADETTPPPTRSVSPPANAAEASQPPRDPESKTPDLLFVDYFDDEGDLMSSAPAIAVDPSGITAIEGLASARFLLSPEPPLDGATAATIRRGGAVSGSIQSVAARDGRGAFVLLGTDSSMISPTPLATSRAEARRRCVLWDDTGAARSLTTLERRSRADFSGEILVFDGNLKPGVVLDDDGRACALAFEVSRNEVAAWSITSEDAARFVRVASSLQDFARYFDAGSARSLLRRARKSFSRGRYEEAAGLFAAAARALTDRDPKVIEEWRAAWRGAIEEARTSDASRRSQLLEAATRDFPLESAWWKELATLRESLGDFGGAIAAYVEAARSDAEVATRLLALERDLYRKWSTRLAAAGRLGEALAIDEAAIRAVGDFADPWRLYGDHLLDARDFAGAAAAYRAAAARDGALAATLLASAQHAEKLADGPGKVVIDYDPRGRVIRTQVTINGRAAGEFIVDTGAQSSMIPEALAKKAGLDTGPNTPRVRVRTAGGERVLPYASLDSMSVGPLSLQGSSAIVGDLTGQGQLGLLGMDFLSSFAFENDARLGRFVIFRP